MDARRCISGRLLLCLAGLAALLLLAACGQQPVAGLPPTATAAPTDTLAPTPTFTPAPSDTPQPTATPTPSPTPLPSDTPTPSATPTPSSTPRPTATPAGFWSDPDTGWSIQFPSDWEAEAGEGDFPALYLVDPDNQLLVFVGSGPSDVDVTLEEMAETLVELFASQDEGFEPVASDWIALEDGTLAYRVTVQTTKPPLVGMQIVLAEKGGRLYIMVVSGRTSTLEARARTIERIVSSLTINPPQLYDVDRNTALVLDGEDPYDLDPATTEEGPADYTGLMFSGLVMLDTNLQVVPDLAQRWEISDDGRTYTFYLHPDARFHDGKPVTAADVAHSWERAADPGLESTKTSTYLGDIVGVKERLAGEAEEIAGVEVVDDHTLRVTIDEPKAYFLAKLTWPVAYVVDRENVESAPGGDEWWRQANGTGPFRLETWTDKALVFARNEDYYGTAPRLEHVVYLLDAGPSSQLYERGEIDMAGVSFSALERAGDPSDPWYGQLHTTSGFCTRRLIFDATQKPFDDPRIRQAFSYAVDREALMEVTFQDAVEPANGPLPPGMPGHSADLEGYHFDPDHALALISRSSYGEPAVLPLITLTTSGYSEPGDYVEAIVQDWEETFGIEIKVELLDPFSYEHEVKTNHGQIFTMGWCADYPDPQNFLDVLYHSDSEENLGHYSNPEVDALLEQGRSEPDPETRLALYQQVEQMIVDDAADIWISHSVSRLLIKPYVHGYVILPIGVPQFQNVYVDPH
jgi:oligopeptide transport system substrate-binding protein